MANSGRADAYYYGFELTGVLPVDAILEAVAQAGKAYHHTSSWDDYDCKDYGDPPKTYAQRIQDAANEAAKEFKAASRQTEEGG